MKYCQHCGKEIEDDAVICVHCGRQVGQLKEPEAQPAKINTNMDTLIKVFLIIPLVLTGIFALLIIVGGINLDPSMAIGAAIGCLVPYAWMIPMTIVAFNKMKAQQPIGIGFGVCCLFFVSLIAGIMIICRDNGAK